MKELKRIRQSEVHYRLRSITSLTFMLQAGNRANILYYDEKNKVNRAIRHCPNEQSIFVDEQSDHAEVEPIIFKKGLLIVGERDVSTIAFLDAHPKNIANGGALFRKIDEEKEARIDNSYEELILDIKTDIRTTLKTKTKGRKVLEPVAAALFGSLADVQVMDDEALKRALYRQAESNPDFFKVNTKGECTVFKDPVIICKYMTLLGLDEGVIELSIDGTQMIWRDTKQGILSAPSGKDMIDFFSEFLTTKEGKLVLDKIKTSL